MARLTLEFEDDIEERLARMRKLAHVGTNVELFQRAMTAYEYLLRNGMTDCNLLIETPDGNVHKVKF